MKVGFQQSIIVVFVSLGLGLFLSAVQGCIPEPTPQPIITPPPNSTINPTATPALPSPTAAATARNAPSGQITIAAVSQPSRELTSLPPFLSDALYDSLLQINPADGSLAPGLAESWDVSEDARTFTFHLRSDVRWHDGQSLNAQDVVFTIKTLSDPAIRITPATDFGPIGDATAPDARTVIVKLNRAYCAALTNLGALKILPKHVLSPDSATGPNKNLSALSADQLIGSGPLILKQWNADAIRLSANANYWNGAPQIADWTYKIFPDKATARAALEAGQADVLDTGASPASFGDSADVKTYSRAVNQFYALAMNNEREILGDVRARQAIGAALDRARLARDVFGDDAQLLETSTLKEFWAHANDVTQPPYDPARARQLLSESGWSDSNGDGIVEKNGAPLRITLWAQADDPVQEPLAFEIRALLSQVGIQALVQLDDRDGYLTRLLLHEYDVAIVQWNIPLDPDQHWYWQSDENKPGAGFNFTSFSNAHMDDVLNQANAVPRCDPKTRAALYADASRTIAENSPLVFLFAPLSSIAARSRVNGLAPSPFAGDYWNIGEWQVK